ncbi:histone-lysine N-methyltransferase PRDM16-like [Aplysia californica]|uniref:Histone-lysine N-methyltransferase PRDM16-like n=1 Tax=Aplysia californica TaxID=6500 RepID=A0ABM0JWF1_APLCA|nr:histone-lysine N-methyltransferase PRDM16-like [Aplysia californica]
MAEVSVIDKLPGQDINVVMGDLNAKTYGQSGEQDQPVDLSLNHDRSYPPGGLGYLSAGGPGIVPQNYPAVPMGAVSQPVVSSSTHHKRNADWKTVSRRPRQRVDDWQNPAPIVEPRFDDCEERGLFVDKYFQPPREPDTEKDQSLMIEQLLRLYHASNLPPVPEEQRSNLLFLRYYAQMKTLIRIKHKRPGFKLQLMDSCDHMAFKNFQRPKDTDDLIRPYILKLGDDQYACRKCSSPDESGVTSHSPCFTTEAKLVRHIQNHLNHYRYVCNFCNKQFNQTADMSLHVKIHIDVRPFKCGSCGKCFIQRVSLNSHLSKHHGDHTAVNTGMVVKKEAEAE